LFYRTIKHSAFFAALLITTGLQAQRLLVSAGPNFARAVNLESDNIWNNVGYGFGLQYYVINKDRYGLRTGMTYQMLITRFDDKFIDWNFFPSTIESAAHVLKLQQIQVPLEFIGVPLKKERFEIYLGYGLSPNIPLVSSSEIKFNGNTIHNGGGLNLKGSTWSMMNRGFIGFETNALFPKNPLSIEVSYSWMLWPGSKNSILSPGYYYPYTDDRFSFAMLQLLLAVRW
jgi:hypothetical protein